MEPRIQKMGFGTGVGKFVLAVAGLIALAFFAIGISTATFAIRYFDSHPEIRAQHPAIFAPLR